MTLLLTDYLLAVYVVAGLIVAAFLGCGIGAHGRAWEVNRATRRTRAQLRAVREQLALAEEALDRATHPVRHSEDLPETDLEGVVRAVTDGAGRALLQPSPPVEDSEAWLWDTTPTPAPARSGPCYAITTNPHYSGGVDTELLCEHPDGDGHTGRHEAADGEVEFDDEGDTWVGGVRL